MKLGNGDKLEFVKKITPRIYLKIKNDFYKHADIHIGKSVQLKDMPESMKSAEYLFLDLCEKIEDKKGKEITPSNDYLLDLDIDDYIKIEKKITEIATEALKKMNG